MRSLLFGVVVAATVLPCGVYAQQGLPQAPFGHRQPTAGNVPSNDSATGGTLQGPNAPGPTPADRALDRSLNICPSC